MAEGTPISYQAATRGTPVLSRSGTKIGTLEHVLEVSDLDLRARGLGAQPARHGQAAVRQAALEARHRLAAKLAAQHVGRLGQRRTVPGQVPATHQGGGNSRKRLGSVVGAEPVRLVRQYDEIRA